MDKHKIIMPDVEGFARPETRRGFLKALAAAGMGAAAGSVPAASVPKPRAHATSKLSITPTLTAGVQVCAILCWSGQGGQYWPGMVVSSRKSDITRRIRSSRSEVGMRFIFSNVCRKTTANTQCRTGWLGSQK